MSEHEKIDYVEFPAKDIEKVKAFFSAALGWDFVDYGQDYTTFSDKGLNGGFFKSDLNVSTNNGSALIVLYSESLLDTETSIKAAGGTIVKPIFSFPGGHRFHFADPNGNEYAVWSDKYNG